MNQSKHILKDIFGYDEFRPMQGEVIANVLEKKDTLAIMPTGSGKSLCYQIPGLIFEGLTVVVSPLISLMQDQINQLRELGVAAVVLNSAISIQEYRDNIDRIKSGQAKFLFVAPETLLKENILALLREVQVVCLAIDEAHCISEWGHDFRPEYRMIAGVRKNFANAVCLALTATATPRVQDDIQKSLTFAESNKFVSSFDRENLFLQIIEKNDPLEQTVSFLNQFPNQSGIIYCFSRKQVDSLAVDLHHNGFSVRPYHAGLSEQIRKDNQNLFIKDDVQIIVATVAFGMGINKPNVRFVVHHDLPKNIESYYQEIGRAGRDGLQAHCLMLFSAADMFKIKYLIGQKQGQEKMVANIQLESLVTYARSEDCRRLPILNYFGENHVQISCTMCDNCLSEPKEQEDLTVSAQKLLSCIRRTNEIFGLAHIIDVLRGSKAKRVLDNGHEKLSTYGIGMEHSREAWSYIGQQLLNKGFLIRDPEYGGLKFNNKTYEILNGETKFLGHIKQEQKLVKSKIVDDVEYDAKLFELLRQKRKELADKINMPPYIIFSDKALTEMAIYFPQSKDNMLTMNGVGEVKLKKYGDVFLEIVRDYAGKNGIEEKEKVKVKRVTHSKSRKYLIVGQEYNSGKSLEQIRRKYKVKKRTVLDNLMKYIQSGETIRTDRLLESSKISTAKQKKVLAIFDVKGCEALKPAFDALNGKVSYDELSLLRLYYVSQGEHEPAMSA